jgi:YD repeat-containing protein
MRLQGSLYNHCKDNLLTGMTLNNQKTFNFVYDGIGRPTSHTVNLIHPLTTSYTYHGITSGGTVYKNNLIRTEKRRQADKEVHYERKAPKDPTDPIQPQNKKTPCSHVNRE